MRTNIPVKKYQSVSTSVQYYPFVDWIRMISMIGIVWAHISNETLIEQYSPTSDIYLFSFFMNFWKFGVICFFMISGFLLGSKIKTTSPLSFFNKRLAVTGKAYLLVILLTLFLYLVKNYIFHLPSSKTFFPFVHEMLFKSSLWFLPNYWIGLIIILLFRKYLDNFEFGLVLFAITLFFARYFVYSSNTISHTYAVLAYVIYSY